MKSNLDEFLRSIGMAEKELHDIQLNMALDRLAEVEDTLNRILSQVDLEESLHRIVALESTLIAGYLDILGPRGNNARNNIAAKRPRK